MAIDKGVPFFFSFFWSHGGGIRRFKQLYERERALETCLDAVTTDNATYKNYNVAKRGAKKGCTRGYTPKHKTYDKL